jgi:uncharacterized cupin superfamily protein
MADDLKNPALDPETTEWFSRQVYPPPYDNVMTGRERRVIGDALGLSQFGVNLGRLAPGAKSSLRHWHSDEDEFVMILTGTPTLVTDEGEQLLGPGMMAGFPANSGNGHRLENRSDAPVTYLEVGTRAATDEVTYPDADLRMSKSGGGRKFFHRDNTPY